MMEHSQNLNKEGKRRDIDMIHNKIILAVEDEPDILYYLKLILEEYEYQVITAEHGKKALKILQEGDQVPDLIISDIKMPLIDGYELFKIVSSNPKLNHIPFIFLSALDEPEDIRLGKLLGVDDYLIKPVNKDDLLATIEGKILRNMKRKSVSKKFDKLYPINDEEYNLKQGENLGKDQIYLLRVDWDDIIGPHLINNYPEKTELPLEKMGIQLFHAINSIYGQKKRLERAEGILINLKNFKVTGYAYFDSYNDENCRGGEREYMFAVIAPQISYYQSLQIKSILKELSSSVTQNISLEQKKIKKYWKTVTNFLIQ
ncbi:MAG: response regulator [Promethearchaeota archaeon]|nr:MAG: response regulator [Candidatus Lokiarchaeota archaeon]